MVRISERIKGNGKKSGKMPERELILLYKCKNIQNIYLYVHIPKK